MKGLIFLLVLFITGCSQIKQLNQNMQDSTQMLTKNTDTVQHSSEAIQKNSQEIAQSTTTMRIYFPIVLVVIIGILFYPTFVLIKLQRKLLQDIRVLVDKLKR